MQFRIIMFYSFSEISNSFIELPKMQISNSPIMMCLSNIRLLFDSFIKIS